MSVRGTAPLIHLLVVLVLPKRLTDRFVLESDKLRAADRASGMYPPVLQIVHLIADYELAWVAGDVIVQ